MQNKKSVIKIDPETMDELSNIFSQEPYISLKLNGNTERVKFILRNFIMAEKGKKQAILPIRAD